jgi:hypothetical protein
MTESEEPLMNLFPKTQAEKLIWERKMNLMLAEENNRLKTKLSNNNSKLIKELNFYKSLYDDSFLVNGSDSTKDKIKNQGLELKRMSEKYLKNKLELERQKELYSGLKIAIKDCLNDFIILLEKTYNEGNEIVDPIDAFFGILENYKKS